MIISLNDNCPRENAEIFEISQEELQGFLKPKLKCKGYQSNLWNQILNSFPDDQIKDSKACLNDDSKESQKQFTNDKSRDLFKDLVDNFVKKADSSENVEYLVNSFILKNTKAFFNNQIGTFYSLKKSLNQLKRIDSLVELKNKLKNNRAPLSGQVLSGNFCYSIQKGAGFGLVDSDFYDNQKCIQNQSLTISKGILVKVRNVFKSTPFMAVAVDVNKIQN